MRWAGSKRKEARGAAQPITVRAARVLDGRGGVLANGVVEVQGSKITAVDQRTGPVTYDLGDVTVLPGMIDVHVHLNWYFGPNGKYGERDVPAGYAMDAVLENARKTLMAGFTTVQSVGWAQDKPLREAIAAGVVVGPRLLVVTRADSTRQSNTGATSRADSRQQSAGCGSDQDLRVGEPS